MTLNGTNAGTTGSATRGAEAIINGATQVYGAGTSLNGLEFTPTNAINNTDQATVAYVSAENVTITNSLFAGGGSNLNTTVRPFNVTGSSIGFTLSNSKIINWSGGGFLNGFGRAGTGSITNNVFDSNGNHINLEEPNYTISGNTFTRATGGAPVAEAVGQNFDFSTKILASNTFDDPGVRDVSIFPSVAGLSITGSSFDDRVFADPINGSDVRVNFVGGQGNDTLYSSSGADTFSGGSGNDVLTGTLSTLNGDTFDVGDFSDRVIVTGTTNLSATISNNRLLIDNGNDGTVDSTIILNNTGGATVSVDAAAGTITFNAPPVAPPAPAPSAGDDNLVGTDAADTIALGTGNDSYSGGGGSDIIYGNQGDDRLSGDAGADTIYGGQGNDVVLGGADADLIYGNLGNDIIYGNQGNDVLYGGQGDDISYGGMGDDVVFGGQGNDVVYGNLGADVVYGNMGADILYGGGGDDVLYGGMGDDVLVGGIGSNILVGGLGADRYVFSANRANDLILGFSQASGDRLSLSGQTYVTSTAADGNALLSLSGGGTVELAGIKAEQVNASYFSA